MMIKEFEGFVNESIWSRTFDEKIEQIDDLLFKGRHVSAIINTNSQKKGRNIDRVLRYYKVFDDIVLEISDILYSIIKKWHKTLKEEQCVIYVKKFKSGVRMLKTGLYDLKDIVERDKIRGALENMNACLYSMDFLNKEHDMKFDYEISYDDSIDIFMFYPHGEKYVEVLRKSETDEKDKKIKELHKGVDPYGEEEWVDENEGIRWYEKGKLKEKEINENDTFFEVGDKVIPIDSWNVYKWHDKHATKHFQPGEEGFWDKSQAFHNENGHWVVDRTIDFDKDGYEGQLIQLKDKFPWYQATSFKKV